jgi:hypothetical protein
MFMREREMVVPSSSKNNCKKKNKKKSCMLGVREKKRLSSPFKTVLF